MLTGMQTETVALTQSVSLRQGSRYMGIKVFMALLQATTIIARRSYFVNTPFTKVVA
jgi:hypothetical protein